MTPADWQSLQQDAVKLGKDFEAVAGDISNVFLRLETKIKNKAEALRLVGKEVNYKKIIQETFDEIEAEYEQAVKELKAVNREFYVRLVLFCLFVSILLASAFICLR